MGDSGGALSLTSRRADGVDGSWYTFEFTIGTPPQSIRLYASTSQSTIWAVLSSGCPDNLSSNCRDQRGNTFSTDTSTSWRSIPAGRLGLVLPFNSQERALNYTGNTFPGYDTVSLNLGSEGGPALANQSILTYGSYTPWVGLFGLNPYNLSYGQNDTSQAPLVTLKNDGYISSLSYGYTAGSFTESLAGSLTLGGYDTLRMSQQNLTLAISAGTERDLQMSLVSAVTSNNNSNPLPEPINVHIDSTVSELWLPRSVCALFESAYNLTWNDTSSLYTITSTESSTLIAANTSVTFSLGDPSSDVAPIDITLPYSSFSMTAECPYVEANETISCQTLYFPLKRAASADEYVLGRTFLQNAYLFTDFERSQFSISQSQAPSDTSQKNLVAVYPPGVTPPADGSSSSSQPDNNGGGGGGSNAGAIAGGVIGGIVALALIILAGWWFWYRPHRRNAEKVKELEDTSPPQENETKPPAEDGEAIDQTWPADVKAELDSAGPTSPRTELASPFSVESGAAGRTGPHELWVDPPELPGSDPNLARDTTDATTAAEDTTEAEQSTTAAETTTEATTNTTENTARTET